MIQVFRTKDDQKCLLKIRETNIFNNNNRKNILLFLSKSYDEDN